MVVSPAGAAAMPVIEDGGIACGGSGVEIHPTGNGTCLIGHRETVVMNIDPVPIIAKGIGRIGGIHTVCGEVRADYGAVIGIAACIIGVAREWIVGNEAFLSEQTCDFRLI